MRAAGERELAQFPTFQSVNGTAELTTLPDQSVDLIVAGQAFHWFDRAVAWAGEFQRILRPGGSVVGVEHPQARWLSLPTNTTSCSRQHGTDYERVRHDAIPAEELAEFLGKDFCSTVLPNEQQFDLEGLKSRVRSSSYTPAVGQPGNAEMMHAIEDLFARHVRHGEVVFAYDTEVYWGRLQGPIR